MFVRSQVSCAQYPTACRNGGTCVNTPSDILTVGFTCQCTESFTGVFWYTKLIFIFFVFFLVVDGSCVVCDSQTPRNCPTSPCVNGLCINNGQNCSCSAGWYGPLCANFDECLSQPVTSTPTSSLSSRRLGLMCWCGVDDGCSAETVAAVWTARIPTPVAVWPGSAARCVKPISMSAHQRRVATAAFAQTLWPAISARARQAFRVCSVRPTSMSAPLRPVRTALFASTV
jgi:hypothetical protein